MEKLALLWSATRSEWTDMYMMQRYYLQVINISVLLCYTQ